MLDRLIPRDDFPGATDAGVDVYILRQLEGDLTSEQPRVATGLAAIESAARTGHKRSFSSLAEEQQDALLEHFASDTKMSPFFNRLVKLAAEDYYAYPGQGGNRDEVSWRMIGYSRRVPDHPTAP